VKATVAALVATTVMEWRKLTSLRLVAVLCLGSVAVSAVLAVFYSWVVIQVDLDSAVSAVEATVMTTSKATVTALVAGVVGVLCVASDRRGGGLAVAAAIEPNRARIVVAKGVVTAAVGVMVGCVGLATNALVAALRLHSHDLLLTDVSSWTMIVVGNVVVHVGWAALGVAVGLAVRATPAAVLTILVGPWFIERTLGLLRASGAHEGVMDALWRVNPFAAAAGLRNPLVVVDPVVDLVGPGPGGGLVVSAFTFTVFVAGSLVLAGKSFIRTDLVSE